MNILVIGKSGQLAQEIAALKVDDLNIVCVGRHDIDLQSTKSIAEVLSKNNANAVINASAYTAVDKAEADAEAAYDINHLAVKNLATCCKEANIHLIHISTDFVFDGKKSSPYLVSDNCDPLSIYGKSKRAGEQELINNFQSNSCIIRTSWVYSTYGANFVKSMLNLMNTREELGIVSDQVGTPTYATDLAKACISAASNRVTGTHHWTDLGVASWYDFAIAIQDIALKYKILNKAIPIKPILTQDYPTPARRPSYSILDKSSCAKAFPEVKSKHWRDQLETMLTQLSLIENQKIEK